MSKQGRAKLQALLDWIEEPRDPLGGGLGGVNLRDVIAQSSQQEVSPSRRIVSRFGYKINPDSGFTTSD